MNFRPVRWLTLICLCLAAFLTGCGPLLDRELEDDKDPNFIDGRNKVAALDYNGAIESFEKALLANPKNAAAHFELAVLFRERLRKHGAAVYHFEKFLELRPKSDKAAIIREHINASIQEQAKSVAFIVIPNDVQKHIEGLIRTNSILRTNIDQLRAVLATRPQYVTNWFTNTVHVTNLPTARAIAPSTVTPPARPAPNVVSRQPVANPQAGRREAQPAPKASTPLVPATHRIQPGDTLSSIAKRYGVPVATLKALNPSVNPAALRAGQEIRVPVRASAR